MLSPGSLACRSLISTCLEIKSESIPRNGIILPFLSTKTPRHEDFIDRITGFTKLYLATEGTETTEIFFDTDFTDLHGFISLTLVFSGFFALKSKLFQQKILRPQECFAFLLCKSAERLNLFAKAKI